MKNACVYLPCEIRSRDIKYNVVSPFKRVTSNILSLGGWVRSEGAADFRPTIWQRSVLKTWFIPLSTKCFQVPSGRHTWYIIYSDAQLCYMSVTVRQHQNVLTMLKMLLPRWGFLIVVCGFCIRPLVKIKKSAILCRTYYRLQIDFAGYGCVEFYICQTTTPLILPRVLNRNTWIKCNGKVFSLIEQTHLRVRSYIQDAAASYHL